MIINERLQTLRTYKDRLSGWRGDIDPKVWRAEMRQVSQDISHYVNLRKSKANKLWLKGHTVI